MEVGMLYGLSGHFSFSISLESPYTPYTLYKKDHCVSLAQFISNQQSVANQ